MKSLLYISVFATAFLINAILGLTSNNLKVCLRCQGTDDFKKALDECKTEIGIEPLQPFKPSNFDDEKRACFNACMMRKRGTMVDGKIDAEKYTEYIIKNVPGEDENLKQLVTECVGTVKENTNDCELAGTFNKCIFEKIYRPLRRE